MVCNAAFQSASEHMVMCGQDCRNKHNEAFEEAEREYYQSKISGNRIDRFCKYCQAIISHRKDFAVICGSAKCQATLKTENAADRQWKRKQTKPTPAKWSPSYSDREADAMAYVKIHNGRVTASDVANAFTISRYTAMKLVETFLGNPPRPQSAKRRRFMAVVDGKTKHPLSLTADDVVERFTVESYWT